ncbi:NADH:ubiquinone oxidoreductase subunit 3 (subunit A) [Nitrospirillum viridazoti]|nr:NADH:ubiquinone oxidoreductase subunit 3 (subunit A) [Nitrospirillum amazonense]TWB38935.1 NADH:ubiquinone oxidoreductase subunit 3 (subunit A) [Nitrospirillum amazonense]TWB56188.1 NADH:ubiquinone oxidoreductase subunit 3 (subunit A) [Nitrospirillum amazonense]
MGSEVMSRTGGQAGWGQKPTIRCVGLGFMHLVAAGTFRKPRRANRDEIWGTLMSSQVMSTELLSQYLPIIIFLAIAGVIAAAMVFGSMLVAKQKPDSEKLSAYECGFEPFNDARSKFDVRFYLVAILFIIFDLEVAFLFPWAVSLGRIGLFGFWSMMAFLGILTIGFIYEWKKGALDWE